MKRLLAIVAGILTVVSTQAKTFIFNSDQWSQVKRTNNGLLQGIEVNEEQAIKLEISDKGQIINIKVFNEKTMKDAKVDGHLE